jgi:tetratricopeptide (TPR) repeat protein
MNPVEDRRHAHALVLEADRARGDGDRARAEHRLRAALAAFTLLEDASATARVLASLADLRFAAGDFAAASDLGRQALERAPGDVAALTGLGYALWLSGSPADGEVLFTQALRMDGSAARALAGRGQVRSEMGDHRGALADLDEALPLELAPDDEADARSARALALAGLGRFDEADTELAMALEHASDRPRSRLRAARIAVLRDRVDQAREQFRQVARVEDPRASAEARSARRLLDRLERSVAVARPTAENLP